MINLFDSIEFKLHPIGEGVCGKLFLPNGYGISVVRFKIPGTNWSGSYCNDETWEVAILKGTPTDYELCYDTIITDNVLTYQTKNDINRILNYLRRLH